LFGGSEYKQNYKSPKYVRQEKPVTFKWNEGEFKNIEKHVGLNSTYGNDYNKYRFRSPQQPARLNDQMRETQSP